MKTTNQFIAQQCYQAGEVVECNCAAIAQPTQIADHVADVSKLVSEFVIADLAMTHLGSCAEKDCDFAMAVMKAYQRASATSAPEQTPLGVAVGEWVNFSDASPPGTMPVLMWNKTANIVHRAETYRFGHPVFENCTHCSHWLKVTPPGTTPQPAPEQPAALKLAMHPMESENGTKGWYVDGPDFYCDIERAPGEQYSIFIRHKDGTEGFAEMSQPAQPALDMRDKYIELLYAVGMRRPNENRHETALRYIRKAATGENVAQPEQPAAQGAPASEPVAELRIIMDTNDMGQSLAPNPPFKSHQIFATTVGKALPLGNYDLYTQGAPAQPVQPADENLLEIIAAAYQIAGAYEAPDYVLDVLANPTTATQEQIDALLPFAPVQPTPAQAEPSSADSRDGEQAEGGAA